MVSYWNFQSSWDLIHVCAENQEIGEFIELWEIDVQKPRVVLLPEQ